MQPPFTPFGRPLFSPLSRLSRRHFLAGTSAALAAPSILRPGRALAEVGSLSFLTYGGLYADTQREAVLDPFAEATGISVNTMAGRDAISALITDSSTDNPAYDLVVLSDVELHIALRQGGLLAELDPANLPHLPEIAEIANALPYSVGVSLNPWGIAYNTDSPAQPRGWADLWAYESPERIVIQQPAAGSARLFNLCAAAIAGGGTWRDVDEIGFAKVKELREKGAQVADLGTSLSLFQNGDVDVLPMYNNETFALADGGFPAAFVFPEDGIFSFGVWLAIPKTLPPDRKAAAERLIDAFLDPAAQTRMAIGVNDGPTNPNAEIPPELAERILTPEKLSRTLQLDWDYIVDNQDRWIDRWNREV